MADELDAQEPEVQETPTAAEVPEQALFEPRNIGEALSMPDPEPQPEPEPEPEPELPPVEPDWLNAPLQQPEPPPQQYYQPQVPDYPQMPPQQPQYQQATTGDAALEAFVNAPEQFINQRVEQIVSQREAALRGEQQTVAYMMSQLVDSNVRSGAAQADAAIKKAYSKFNEDPAFRSNKEMQERIGATLRGMRQQAEYEARARGNFAPLQQLANLSEAEIAGALAYVKAMSGVYSGAAGPMQIEGAQVESSRAPTRDQSVELTPEQEEIARRMGPGYRAKLIEAQKELTKHNDLEWRE